VTTSTDEQLTERPDTAEDLMVEAMLGPGLPFDQEVTVTPP
jgi:hypothetical protein